MNNPAHHSAFVAARSNPHPTRPASQKHALTPPPPRRRRLPESRGPTDFDIARPPRPPPACGRGYRAATSSTVGTRFPPSPLVFAAARLRSHLHGPVCKPEACLEPPPTTRHRRLNNERPSKPVVPACPRSSSVLRRRRTRLLFLMLGRRRGALPRLVSPACGAVSFVRIRFIASSSLAAPYRPPLRRARTGVRRGSGPGNRSPAAGRSVYPTYSRAASW
jgi:hypothetical protein